MSTEVDQRLSRFTELLSAYQSSLLASAYAMVQNMADAEDIYQRAAMILWRKFDDYEEGSDFRAWASTVVRYVALNFIRKRRNERVFFADEVLFALAETADSQSSEAELSEIRWSRLSDCITRLSSKQRRLLELYYGDERPIAVVAETLNATEGAIRTALCRIRQSLKRCVDHRSRETFV